MMASAHLMQILAWSLLHFLWQGFAIAALAAAIMFVFRKPSTRYLVGIGALVLMLASFAITFTLISGATGSADVSAAGLPAAALEATPYAVGTVGEVAPAVSSLDPAGADFLWIARGWLFGVFCFALRIACGLLLLEHLRRRNLAALPAPLVEKFRALQHRLGIRRAIRYCECRLLGVPAVIGFFKPIVLLPVRALTGLTPEQLEAVIAHELGHIKRFDVAVNFFQVIAETLFFFHPAVWWLNKRIRADREDCCDDVAIEACGGTVGYARALATMEGWRGVPSFAMAATGSPVAVRVARLLGVRQSNSGARAAGVVTASLVLATALIAGAVSIGVANPARAQSADSSFQTLIAQVDAPVPVPGAAPPVPAVASPPPPEAPVALPAAPVAPALAPEVPDAPVPAVAAQPAVPAIPARPVKQAKPPREARPAREDKVERKERVEREERIEREEKTEREERIERDDKRTSSGGSYIRDMKSVGLDNLDVDQLIALKSQGVTPEYVRSMRGTGFNPDVNLIIAMKVHGVTPDYVKEVRALGFKPDADEVIAMRNQGVTAEYVKGMRDLGVNPEVGDFIAMKIQGVTPEYVRQIRTAGFAPNNQELIAMKVHDVTPEYRKALEDAGYKLDVSETIAAKVMNITPEFIAKVRAGGFKNMSIDKLIQLKNADIL